MGQGELRAQGIKCPGSGHRLVLEEAEPGATRAGVRANGRHVPVLGGFSLSYEP